MGSLQPDYYEREQLDDQHPLQDFHQLIKTSRIRAVNPATSSQRQEFVPFQEIEDYLDQDDRLADVLSAVFPDEDLVPVEPSVVRRTHLRVFCILLYIGKARYIRSFVEYDALSDVHLPFSSEPYHFPISTSQPNLWDSFYENQWMFCAAEMQYKMQSSLDASRILPVVKLEKLAEGMSAVVSRIVLHPSFNKLRRDRAFDSVSVAQYKDTFVLKTYHETPNAKDYYDNEVDAFRRLQHSTGSSDPNIIHFRGSYKQNGTYNVILDFADQGNLEQYFQNVLPPTSGGDIEHFWASICGVLKALIHIHQVNCQNILCGPQIFQGHVCQKPCAARTLADLYRWHQDVKPENILVMSNNTDSPYNWKFILSDLGLSHFKRTSHEGSDLDTYGTQTYGAPECYREDGFLQHCSILVKQNVDIWSLGCVFSEAAVWLVHGYTGLEKFRTSRHKAIAEIPDIQNGDRFHNGKEVLPIVLRTLDGLEKDFRISDRVTGRILQLVKNMLDTPETRQNAKALYEYANRIFRTASTMGIPSLGSPTTQTFSPYPMALPGPSMTAGTVGLAALGFPPAPQTTSEMNGSSGLAAESQGFQNGYDPKLNLHTSFSPCPPAASESVTSRSGAPLPAAQPSTPKPSIPNPDSSRAQLLPPPNEESSRSQLPELPVDVAEQWIKDKKAGRHRELQGEYLLERLETLDHVFLIDNATTMKSHKAEVERILHVLAYLLKDADPDGMELYFTGGPDKKIKSKNPSKIVEKFVANNPRGRTDIRRRLTVIINQYIEGFDKPWYRSLKKIRSLNIYILTDGIWQPEIDLAPLIQRLLTKLRETGRHQVGIQFISFGHDTEALQRLDHLDDELDLEGDIIDHEPSTGNVWKMLFGSTDPWFDGKSRQTADTSQSAESSGR